MAEMYSVRRCALPFVLLNAALLSSCDRSAASGAGGASVVPPSRRAERMAPAAPEASVVPVAAVAQNVALTIGAPSGVIAAYTGINTGPTPTQAGDFNLTPLYTERGLNLIRTHDFNGAFDLVDVNTATPFSQTDVELAAIRAGGFQLYLRLGNSYRTSDGPQDPATIVDGMVRMLRHVNAGDPSHPVRYVEIWNEPDAERFWRGTAEEFAQVYIKAARAIRAVDPNVRIGGPAFSAPCTVFPDGKAFVATFLSEVRKSGAPMDFLSWHLYANDPTAFADAAKEYRKSLERAGFGDLEQIVSEWNTSYKRDGGPDSDNAAGAGARPGGQAAGEGGPRGAAAGRAGGPAGGPPGARGQRPGGPNGRPEGGPGGGAPGGGGPGGGNPGGRPTDISDLEVRTGARASALTTGAWIAMQQNGVDQEFYYRGPDPLPYPSGRFGMFYSDGEPKPSGYAALLWKQLVDHPTMRTLTGPTSGPLWALAGENGQGETAVLLANAGAAPLSWSLAGAGDVKVAQLTRLRGTARALEETTIAGTSAGLGFTLDAYETALLRFTSGGK